MIKREISIFLTVGALTVLTDYLIYQFLVWSQWLTMDFAKGISFIVGTIFAYFANRFWTFGHKRHVPGSIWRFSLLYATTLLTNVVVNAVVVNTLVALSWVVEFAFIMSTVISASMNFVGLKYFVFKKVTQIN
jgi:putative flippase GtrA